MERLMAATTASKEGLRERGVHTFCIPIQELGAFRVRRWVAAAGPDLGPIGGRDGRLARFGEDRSINRLAPKMGETRLSSWELVLEDGSGVWLRGGHSRRGSGDKKILGGGFEAVIAIAAVTEDHQRIKGDGELKETLDARDILFDSRDEAK